MHSHRRPTPSSIRRNRRSVMTAQAVESLESRRFFDTTPFLVSSGTRSENWEAPDDTKLTTDSWANIPNFVGYRGDSIAFTNLDPRTATGAGTNVVDVNVNQTPSATVGGVSEVILPTAIGSGPTAAGTPGTTGLNTIAIQGSGTAAAPFLQAYLNTTGVAGVRVKFDVIDIDSEALLAQPFVLQYRVGDTGNWSNVDGTYLAAAAPADATTGTTNGINVLLPADAVNQSLVELRWITINNSGNDQFLAIDNIEISAANVSGPGTFAISDSSVAFNVAEAVGTATVTVTRSGGSSGAATIAYTLGGTATAGQDYTAPTGTISFADGETSKTISIPITNDTTLESSETIVLTLTSTTAGSFNAARTTSTITIVDDDDAGTFNITPTSTTVQETAGTVTLTINRTVGSGGAVDLPYTIEGTATAGQDYTAPSATVSFAAGQTSATITIPIIDDTIGESPETIVLTLGQPSAGTLGSNSSTTITIRDNDSAGTVAFAPATYSVSESGGTVTLTLTRIDGSSGTASVNYTLVDGTATAASDYVAASGTVTFADGETTKTITLALKSDTTLEADETFTVVLSNPSTGVTIGTAGTATVTIVDDDGVVPTGLVLNEVFINPPSVNTPYQFIELRGTPGQILRDVYILVLEGDNTNGAAGAVDGVINLTNAVIGSNGLLLVRAAAGFAAESASSGVFDVPFFSGLGSDFGLETGSLSLLLFYRDTHLASPAAIPAVGDDLDTDNLGTSNVGTLEGLPSSGYTPLDSVGLLDGNTSDLVYVFGSGAVIPAFGTNSNADAADYLARLENNVTPNSTAAWYYANLVNGPNGEQSTTKTLATDTTRRSANTPADARVTPGGFFNNTAVATTVQSVTLNVNNPVQSLTVAFSQSVAGSLDASDFELKNITNNTTVTLTLQSLSADGKTATLTFSGVTGSAAPTVLSTGNYTLRVKGGTVDNIASDITSPLYFVNGDFDRDRDVDFNDLLTLAKNYNTQGKTWAQGDTDYDGDVDFSDLLTLAKSYNFVLAQPPAAFAVESAPVTRTRASFGSSVIA